MNAWKTGNPEKDGQYLVKYMSESHRVRTDVDVWQGGKWYWWGQRVIKWADIPKDEEEEENGTE